ncbi:MAG: lanthionine synthetase LanC family protein [bacterium]|nr:lanthionine synthetase LanC family protein [bacterium]
MGEDLRHALLVEVTRIGDELLALAEQDGHGLSWKTVNLDKNADPCWEKHEHIYAGTSGIALFLLELYRQTKVEKYLCAADEGMRWVDHYCETNPTSNYAFFTGRVGVAYTMVRMAQATGKANYLERALRIAASCDSFLSLSSTVDNIINGASGTLLGLLHLHAATGERWVLDKIDHFTRHLILRAHPGPKGLYWDCGVEQIRSMGFSHGASGLGFVFLEMGHYFVKKQFYWMADQAFAYETHFYDDKMKNWPEIWIPLSQPGDYQRYERAFLNGDLGLFSITDDQNAWCHGATGVGLSRLRAWQLMERPNYNNEFQIAVERTKNDFGSTAQEHPLTILCHGIGGNAELFLEAYRIFRDEQYLAVPYSMAERALNIKKTNNEYLSGFKQLEKGQDSGLFMGTAGIGYFYLRCLDPIGVPSILLPKLDAVIDPGSDLSSYRYIGIPQDDLQKLIIETSFARTLFVAQKLAPAATQIWLSSEMPRVGSIPETFIRYIDGILKPLPEKDKALLNDVFSLETAKYKLDKTLPNLSLRYVKRIVNHRQATALLELGQQALLNRRLRMDKDIKLHSLFWHWGEATIADDWENNLAVNTSTYLVLLAPSTKTVIEQELSSFSHAVISAFKEGNTTACVIPVITKHFGDITTEQGDQIRTAIIEQVKQALLTCILIVD